jgi:pyruvate dehydrogenase E2 component (dihydrolipoamide acetyltransferase)
LARRIAAIKGVELSMLSGSGPHGRIVRRDVETATAAATAAPAPAPVPVAPIADAPASTAAVEPAAVEALYRPGSYDVVKLDAMRRAIARRLTESKQTVPHFYLRADVELDALMALRAQVNAAAPVRDGGAPTWRISVNDMVIKALSLALRDVPDANVTWAHDSILRHHTVDVAVAVAIEGGLITPIIRNAAAKSLSTISGEMKDLAARARARRLAPEEYQGGSTSVSNLGMYGVASFDAVINPPHGTILAVGAAGRRPVVRGDQLAVATVMTVTLSVDHRAVDGALGAELLDAFKRYAENPLTLMA